MTIAVAQKREDFRKLHESGCFVIPNPWDAGSAKALAHLGFKALASTSAGFAWSLGKADNRVTCDDVIAHLEMLCIATELPVNADFENGFADDPNGVAVNVTRAIGAGVAGLSIEDSTGKADAPLYDFELAVERIRAARAAIDASKSGVMLTARSEGFFVGVPDLDETLRRLKAYSDAGADCLYAPGIRDKAQIGAVVKAVAPKPVNSLIGAATVTELSELGVRRISTGGALARAGWATFMAAAQQIAEQGSFAGLAVKGVSGRELNAMFSGEQK